MPKNNKSQKGDADQTRPPQAQDRQPGRQHRMRPAPKVLRKSYRGSGKLKGRRALITGGDSGIGRSVAVAFAREGADVAVVYLDEHKDAKKTASLVEKEGRRCELIDGDVGDRVFCQDAVKRAVKALGGLDVLVNNAAEQHPTKDFAEIDEAQLVGTFRTNIFAYFFLAQAALPHLRKRSGCVVNTTSVTAYRGSAGLVDYASTKGAIVSFTRSLALNLVKQGVRVNAVAPGPVWTPLIPATFPEQKVASFGGDTPMQRPGEPAELAAAYVYLACEDSSYVTGQVMHVNGGEIVNG